MNRTLFRTSSGIAIVSQHNRLTIPEDEATAQPEPLYLSRADAAAYVAKKFGFPCSEQTLAKLAVQRQGPQFKRANGRFAVYPVPGLDAWAVTRFSNVPEDGAS